MKKISVFSGTSEGKKLCAILDKKGIYADVYVATDYGKEVMEPMEHINIITGRKNREDIEKICALSYIVADATHPYALEVTRNIKTGCIKSNTQYIRIERNIIRSHTKEFSSHNEVIDYLKNKEGNIFVSTGRKDLYRYKVLDSKRIFARVIPDKESEEACKGFENIIFSPPPFTYEDNIRHFKDCRFLVTKNSGKEGGFYTKLEAAEKLGIEVLVIAPPVENKGITVEEAAEIIAKQL